MNALFRNVRGISAPGRKPQILDVMNKIHPSFVGFQETKKEVFSDSFLKSISGNRSFSWNHLPSVGSAGGILMGVDSDILEVISWQILEFAVSCKVKLIGKDVEFRVTTVYGSPYEEGKGAFISELHSFFVDDNTPTLIGGDFNLIRYAADKNNGNINRKWSDSFNVWMEIWSLLEIKLSSRKYTWANNQEDLIMSTIDRIFCNTELDSISPLSSSLALPRCGSDHTPIVWDSGLQISPRSSSFKMEKWWLLREDFRNLIEKTWNSVPNRGSSLDVWQAKIRKLRRITKGWSSN